MTGSSGQRTDFAGADIRGADFRNWKLAGANFAGARAGIGRRWVVGYCAGSLLAAALARRGFNASVVAQVTREVLAEVRSEDGLHNDWDGA